MSQRNKKTDKKFSPTPNLTKQSPKLQPQLEKTIVHLETVLMLTQLNSTFFKLKLTLQKATNKLAQKYFKTKMNAFLAIQNYRYDQLEVNSKRVEYEVTQSKGKMSSLSDELEYKFQEEEFVQKFQQIKKNADYRQMAMNTRVKCQFKLQRLSQLLKIKQKGVLSSAFYKLEYHREASIANIYSEKSSKIETNESQKSKIFRRSVEKKQNRKSFSLQKSGISQKHDYYVPVKYQPSRGSCQLSVQSQQKNPNSLRVSSMLGKFLQNVGDSSKERRNNLQIDRQKKQAKHSSTKKYNTSLVNYQRQEKINQLDYLRRKYKKLIDQFSWFSQRFLKVIEEEEYVQ